MDKLALLGKVRSVPYFGNKLMRLDHPQAKFCLKSDSNSLLIDFFDLIPTVLFSCRNDWIRIRTMIRSKVRL